MEQTVVSEDYVGKVCLVTGGSRGMGREMVLAFAEAGADVVITSRNLEACEAVAREVEEMGRKALPIACHVGHWDDVQRLIDTTYETFGRVDVLVNNAGKSPFYDGLESITPEYLDSVMNLNLRGPFQLAVHIGYKMKAAGSGSIISISSAAAYRPDPESLPYAFAKAALNNMTAGLAQALGPEVRVNSIIAGAFATDVSKHWSDETREELVETASVGRVAEPREMAGPALFLGGSASSFVTGSMLFVDGGLTRRP
jgi:NAD(P)-dependent dehydrogenase (short-subunit alcohol dehydrogenase family)